MYTQYCSPENSPIPQVGQHGLLCKAIRFVLSYGKSEKVLGLGIDNWEAKPHTLDVGHKGRGVTRVTPGTYQQNRGGTKMATVKNATTESKASTNGKANGTDPAGTEVDNLTARQAHAELHRLEVKLGFPVWDNRGGSFPAIAASADMARARACWEKCSPKKLLADFNSDA